MHILFIPTTTWELGSVSQDSQMLWLPSHTACYDVPVGIKTKKVQGWKKEHHVCQFQATLSVVVN